MHLDLNTRHGYARLSIENRPDVFKALLPSRLPGRRHFSRRRFARARDAEAYGKAVAERADRMMQVWLRA